MSDELIQIEVYPKVPSLLRKLVAQAIWWVCLVGAAGGSRIWFGGSWVIDTLVLLAAILIVIALLTDHIKRSRDEKITLARDDVPKWVSDGMPIPWTNERKGA